MPIPFEKILTPGVRAGNTVERVGKMIEAGVCKIAIAAQMTHSFSLFHYVEGRFRSCSSREAGLTNAFSTH